MSLEVSERQFNSGEEVPFTGKYLLVGHEDKELDKTDCKPLAAERSITLMKGDIAPKLFVCQHKVIWKLETV